MESPGGKQAAEIAVETLKLASALRVESTIQLQSFGVSDVPIDLSTEL